MGIIINGLTDTVTAADGSLNIGGDVTIPGELSYDDVTNIDSIGIITARSDVSIADKIVHTGDTDTAIRFPGDDQVSVETGGTQRLLIGSDGKLVHSSLGAETVDFGTSNSSGSYHRYDLGSSGATLGFIGAGSQIVSGSNVADFGIRSQANLVLASGGDTERARITSDGKFGLGTQTPADKLSISGGSLGIYNTGNNHGNVYFYKDGTPKGWLKYRGNDEKLVIGNVTDAINVLSSGNVGVNIANPERKLEVVDTAGSLTFPVAVSNHTDASAGVGAGIAFHLTSGGNTRGDFGVVYAGNSNSDGTDFVFRPNDGSTGSVERLRIKGSSGRIGINETSPTALLDINHPNTVRGLVVRSRYGDINNAMVKFDADPDTNNGDGNVLHIHGGNSRTDSEILNIDSTGCGNIFQIRGDGLTRVYKHLQIEHASNTAKIIFNEFGANDIKAQIEMDQINGSNGQLRFYTQGNGTSSERMRITNSGYVLKSDTPAFQCKLSTATGANFNGYLIFNSVRYNIGNHYNSSNGRFTAPVDGRYLFSWYTNMLRDGGTGSLWADWYVNGGAQGNRMYTHYSGAWELIGGTIIMDLNSSDYVQVYTGQNGNWDGGSYGAFSGYLLG